MSTNLLDTDNSAHELYSDFSSGLIPLTDSTHWEEPKMEFYFRCKYILDRIIAISLLIILCPLIAALWLIVKATSPGSGFYSQTRVGQSGREFKVFKLRSMHCDAEAGGKPIWSSKQDKRITSIGKILRKLHLDELPQLWNVALGEMSLVGPRPERPEITTALEKLIPRYQIRHTVKPGITGLAQVSGRSDVSFEQRLSMDLDYAQQVSWWRDVKIIWLTVCQLGGKQAN